MIETDNTSNIVSQFLKSVFAPPIVAKDKVEVENPKTVETSGVECVDVDNGSISADSLNDSILTWYGNVQMNIEGEVTSNDNSSASS